jgi:hypothetical protein
MAEVLPINFAVPGENILSTYDYADIASGTGYISFYAGVLKSSNCLSNIIFWGNTINTSGTNTTTSYVKVVDVDFDALLNKPLVLRGKAIINVPYSFIAGNGAFAGNGYIVAKIRKWDGSTETEIANNTGTTRTDSAGVLGYYLEGLDITVPLTNFKKGEYIRLTIEGWAKNDTNGQPSTITICHDPKNRTWGTSLTSQLLFFCPVRIDA